MKELFKLVPFFTPEEGNGVRIVVVSVFLLDYGEEETVKRIIY
jgi:hypothetical protein